MEKGWKDMTSKTIARMQKVKDLVAGGAGVGEACKQAGLALSLYYKYKKQEFATTVHNVVKTKRAYQKRPDVNKLAVVFGSVDQIRELLR